MNVGTRSILHNFTLHERCDVMRLILSCYCCGGITFEYISNKDYKYKIEGETYIHPEDVNNVHIKCKKCGLVDNLENLVINVK